MAPEVSGGGWRTLLALRWKWKHREQKDSSHHPLPGTGVLNTHLRGRPAEPAGGEPLILAEGPATLGAPAARSGPAGRPGRRWRPHAAWLEPSGLERRGRPPSSSSPGKLPSPHAAGATGGHWDRGSPLIPDPNQPIGLPCTHVTPLTLRLSLPGSAPLGCWHTWGMGAPLARRRLFREAAGVCPLHVPRASSGPGSQRAGDQEEPKHTHSDTL